MLLHIIFYPYIDFFFRLSTKLAMTWT